MPESASVVSPIGLEFSHQRVRVGLRVLERLRSGRKWSGLVRFRVGRANYYGVGSYHKNVNISQAEGGILYKKSGLRDLARFAPSRVGGRLAP